MTTRFPKGSEWRKWDLHVHTPCTKKNDQYVLNTGENLWETFCQKLYDSDVYAFGICDYFSVANYFTFIGKYQAMYPNSQKIFFPNIELCTSDVVNNAHEEVNVHLVFNPEIPNLKDKLTEFLGNLKTNKTDSKSRHIIASELSTVQDFEEATTTKEYIKIAFEETFGSKVETEDYVVIVTAANNDGLRTGTEEVGGSRRGIKRKAVITDELDKFSHAFFGNSGSVDYFTNEDRLEGDEKISVKPVTCGSDSHSFEDLDSYLGKQFVDVDGNLAKDITWIKADLTFEGLKQVLYEPISGERIYIGPLPPDKKLPDRVISKLIFENTSEFPQEIIFNESLTSIIGSRSSGKSALLAYLAYAVDPDTTMQIKGEGPAANIPWDSISLNVKVEWGNGLSQKGKVIYIPQNHLYKLSRRPEEITSMIKPVLFDKYSEIKQLYDKLMIDLNSTQNKAIEDNTQNWIAKRGKINSLEEEKRDIGDKEAIQKVIESLERQIEELKEKASLSEEDVKSYKELSQQVHIKRGKLKTIVDELKTLSQFFVANEENGEKEIIGFVTKIGFDPSIQSLPDQLQTEISDKLPQWSSSIIAQLQEKIILYENNLQNEQTELTTSVDKLLIDNEELISRCKQNAQLQDLIEKLDKQKAKRAKIDILEIKVDEEKTKLLEISNQIKSTINERSISLQELSAKFIELEQSDATIKFGVEIEFNPDNLEKLSARFNRKENSAFIKADKLKINSIRQDPSAFMDAVYMTTQKVLSGQDQHKCLMDVLTFTEEVRFKATMENDTIGGFSVSSMTEGKQALFALTLLLNKESETWPLLIDQPEDDLDSRSIYSQIVPYLKEQKKRRQIIMVSHNANLVIGADTEQVIVANQHGGDRKNKDNQKFDYFSGSLEFTKELDSHMDIVLYSCGIREHACDILDGGISAFEKRKHKYNL